jgi:TetR/AcrR family transcriptional regulator, cholesterol catabolism regulator
MSAVTNMTDRSRPPRRAGRGGEILAIASRLFYENDYHSVGMRMIADTAGVRGATLYHHFGSKEDMLFEIVLEVTRDFIDDRLTILDGTGTHVMRLRKLLEDHVEYFWEHRYGMAVALREIRNLTPEHATEVRAHRLRYQHAIQDFIAAGVAASEFHCDDPKLVGVALLDMVNGIDDWFDPAGRLSLTELAVQYSALIVHQLLGAAAATEGDPS